MVRGRGPRGAEGMDAFEGRRVGKGELADQGAAIPFGFLWWSAVYWLLGFRMHYSDCACSGVFFKRGGCDGKGDFEEADGLSGGEAEVVVRVYFAEVTALDVDFSCERDGVCLLTIEISLQSLTRGRVVAVLGKRKA